MKSFFLIFSLVLASYVLHAQSGPTWAGSVAGIVYQNCTNCHRTGAIAPFMLESFDDAVANATQIRDAVADKHMPPWPPDPAYRHFQGERALSQDKIDSIVGWIDAGMPRGDQAKEPASPVYSDAFEMAYPADTSVRIPTYTVSSKEDLYRCFVIPSGLTVQKFLRGVEFVAGNKNIVHHILLFADTTGQCRQLDAADPQPGYTNFGGTGVSGNLQLAGWAPGAAPNQYPAGFGMRITPKTDYILQVHYAPGSLDLKDSSYVRLSYAPDGQTKRLVYVLPILNYQTSMVNGPLQIEPNTTKTFLERFTTPFKLSLFAVGPHGHNVCQNWKVYATKIIGNKDTLPIIKIKKWDFHWQGSYLFDKPLIIEAGMNLEAQALYDNTTNNPKNPFSPPQQIVAGENTSNEMMLVYFNLALYQTGDENLNLVIPTAVKPTSAQKGKVWYVNQGFVKAQDRSVPDTWELRTLDGRLVAWGTGNQTVPLTSKAQGVYALYITKHDQVQAIRVLGGPAAY